VDGFYGAERPVKVVGSVKHPSGETVADELPADIKTLQRTRRIVELGVDGRTAVAGFPAVPIPTTRVITPITSPS
jgi:hypothetical protein